jgi:ATP-dependent HslUV protease ATP-binding subunit HslU
MQELTPRQIVEELDKYIVGQGAAKRAVAVAVRNRLRRQRIPAGFQDEVAPKNILMIGPTGVGKTEMARRLARLVNAPFIKVEATKFTEVGYVGRDVDSIVRDLVEASVRLVKSEYAERVRESAQVRADERLLELLAPTPRRRSGLGNPFQALLGSDDDSEPGEDPGDYEDEVRRARFQRRKTREALSSGTLEEEMVEIELEDTSNPMADLFEGAGIQEVGANFQELFGGMLPKRKKKRRVTVREARRLLANEEAQKLVDTDAATGEAIHRAEQLGIVFIDELDKVAGREGMVGPDVSREGVQRDILPIVEGSTVNTKYGPVRTDHMLFIAAGAFHMSKPSDLIPELQGRFPVRVELDPLTAGDFVRILSEPQNSLVKQYQALLATEGIELVFTPEAIAEIAAIAYRVNEQGENIGARRLHTVMEKLLEELAFSAPEMGRQQVIMDRAQVTEKLADIAGNRDLAKYVL